MKNLRVIAVFAFLILGVQSKAQSFADGIYTTTFGNISWTTETGSEYPNSGIVYGDYKDKGTIIGSFDNNAKEVKGTFFNGSSEGKFVFIAFPGKTFFDQSTKTFSGYWGYNSDNKYSQNVNYQWNVTGKIGEKNKIQNETNVWSGKWNTTDGNMILQQVGNKVTGTYKGIGTVTATYNPATRLLKGTFLNQNSNKTGYLEFYFEGNTFKGKWGWTTAMTSGNWDGTKHVKNNKELSKAPTNTNSLNNLVSANETVKIRVRATFAMAASNSVVILPDLYGFAGFELKKITQNETKQVKSFGDKTKYLFETTENTPLIKDQVYINFPDQPTYYRDYIILKSDWENKNINFELDVFHHLKAKEYGGPNRNCGYFKETFNLRSLKPNTSIKVPKTAEIVCRLQFQVEIL